MPVEYGFKNRSWWETSTLEKSYDLVVIGAGITGLSSAHFFLRKHPKAKVLILERGYWPSGATTRNAGFACFGSAGELTDDLLHSKETEVRQLLEFRLRGLNLLKTELGEDEIGYHQCGGYEFFDHPKDEHYLESVGNLEKFSSWVEEVTGEKDSYQPLMENGKPAIYNRLEGAVDSGKLMRSLLKKAKDSGAEVRMHAPVQEIGEGEVKLKSGIRIKSESVLVAVNGFTGDLLKESNVKPARGYVFVTNPLKKKKWKGTCHYNRGYVYFRDLDGRLLLGGARDVDIEGERTSQEGINPQIKKWLIDFANNYLELEEDWNIEKEWSGVMGFGKSKTPEIIKSGKNVVSIAGLGGMGVAIGMETARRAINEYFS